MLKIKKNILIHLKKIIFKNSTTNYLKHLQHS
jgi:hypothetical protein